MLIKFVLLIICYCEKRYLLTFVALKNQIIFVLRFLFLFEQFIMYLQFLQNLIL